MKAAVIVFPGSNCDRDMKVALEQVGFDVTMVWHADSELPQSDLVVLPGGFSYGDYLRCGAIAAKSPIVREVVRHAEQGGYLLGVCNGFQVLCETQLLPGVLMRNENLRFICRDVTLQVVNTNSFFTRGFVEGRQITVPIAHHDGNYRIDDAGLEALMEHDQIAFTYADENPNGSVANIAGVLNRRKTILGMMPHPERLIHESLGGTDGKRFFDGVLHALA